VTDAGTPIALEAYEQLAEAYAAHIDTKPHNAYCERPATLSLLPDVRGLRVLDAGCGSGIYAEWLLDRQAEVVALDASPKMVAFATERTGGRATIHVADLSARLDFLGDASFDVVVSPLVMEYVRDWRATFAEFHRVLRPGGVLVVSVTHPFSDFTYYNTKRYFEVEPVQATWGGFTPVRVRMPSYRRSLEETLNPFADTGFRIERLLEPRPTAEFKAADPKHYAELMRLPCFLCIRATKAL
jgi:SAM-dependent methyltransferase